VLARYRRLKSRCRLCGLAVLRPLDKQFNHGRRQAAPTHRTVLAWPCQRELYSDLVTRCAYKGEASYFSTAGQPDLAWGYREPLRVIKTNQAPLGWTPHGGSWSVTGGRYVTSAAAEARLVLNTRYFVLAYDADVTIDGPGDAGVMFRAASVGDPAGKNHPARPGGRRRSCALFGFRDAGAGVGRAGESVACVFL